jgi:hypothetical protein
MLCCDPPVPSAIVASKNAIANGLATIVRSARSLTSVVSGMIPKLRQGMMLGLLPWMLNGSAICKVRRGTAMMMLMAFWNRLAIVVFTC